MVGVVVVVEGVATQAVRAAWIVTCQCRSTGP